MRLVAAPIWLGATDESAMKQTPAFKSRLRPLSIVDYERMTPAQLQRREAEEEQERRDWVEAQRRAAQSKPARRP